MQIITESKTSNCLSYKKHDSFQEIVLIEQGSGIHILNGYPQAIYNGSIFVIENSFQHSYEKVSNLRITKISYHKSHKFLFLKNLQDFLPTSKNHRCISQWQTNKKITCKILSIASKIHLFSRSNTKIELSIRKAQEKLFLQLLLIINNSFCFKQTKRKKEKINDVIDWLTYHYNEEIIWEELAKQFSVSLRTLYRGLKKQTGKTPHNYLNFVRLFWSRYFLRHTKLHVTDIAFQCGFNDSNYFSTLFKKEFGYSPKLEKYKI